MEENNAPTKLLGGVTGKGFLPGQSGNPSGRPRSLANIIREQTKNGAEIVTFLLNAMRNEDWKDSDRLKAADMLFDRGCFPRTPPPEEQGDLPALNLSDLTEKELCAFEQFGLVLASIRQRAASGAVEAEPK